MRPRVSTIVMLLAAVAGLAFSGWSTADFVQHLDRQVHGIHCSFIPGLDALDVSGASGCHVALMSTWSSVFRSRIWGGLPVALPGMAVFAFLLYRAVELLLNRRQHDRDASAFLVAAWLLPVLTSLFFGFIALTQLDAFCKLCVGIYLSSFTGFGAALAGLLTRDPHGAALAEADDDAEDDGLDDDLAPAGGPIPWGLHLGGFGEGVLFVAVPVLLYAGLAPDFTRFVGACGTLPKPDDPYGILVPIGAHGAGADAIEVLDPLCPSCAGMEKRLKASGLGERLDRKAVLFPLDDTCNWMVGSAIHPGACTVSEAVLCAGDQADAVLAWAFEHGEEIRAAASVDPDDAGRMVKAAFPSVGKCLGSAAVRTRLNRSLRWIVANQLPVLTPQLYVEGRKVCDDDTDLGLDWALSHLLAQGGAVEGR
ncbi:MAG: hypothetical protein H6733_13175 [Alphaproteobacteria bacterium]|nr:hypothetical protein [Alphaproteobacteria bacterium]